MIQLSCARISLAAITLVGLASCHTVGELRGRYITSPADVNEHYREVLYQRSTQYRVRPGDSLSVNFLGEADYSQNLLILPDGRADPYFMSNAVLAGKTVKEIEEEVQDAYKNELNEPVISIGVQPFEEVVYIQGPAHSTQTLPYRLNMTLAQAIIRSSNNPDISSLDDVVLRRPYSNPRNPDIFYVDYYDESEEVFLLPNDQIIMTRTSWIVVRDYIREYLFGVIPVNSMMRSGAAGAGAF